MRVPLPHARRAGNEMIATGLDEYERTRRHATAAVVAANRAMRHTGPARSPSELAEITSAYRRDTGADIG